MAGLIELLTVARELEVFEVGRARTRGRRHVLRASERDEPVRKLELRSTS